MIDKFITLHTQTLLLIFQFNSLYSQLLFLFMGAQLPINTYLITRLMLSQFNIQTSVIFINFISLQYICILFFHILSAMYCHRIHSCSNRLFHINANSLNKRDKGKLSASFKIDLYIAKFNTNKKYGISYGPFGLMTFNTFAKVTLEFISQSLCLIIFILISLRYSTPNLSFIGIV